MDEPTEWKTWKLWKRTTIPLATFDIAIIAVVLALEHTSTTHNGIATISSIPTASATHFSVSNLNWSYGLLWTSFPALLMTFYRITWESLVTAAADRQPFVELARSKDDASNVRRTIMLDYRSYPSFYRWAIAFRNRHHLLGFSMVLSVLLSIVLVPLASHLFAAAPTDVLSEMTVSLASAFDDESISRQTDLQAPINIAAAVSIFGAIPPPWSTAQYAFQPYEILDNSTNGNVTTRSTAYSGVLDCQVKTGSDFSVVNGVGVITFQGIDRDCAIPEIQANVGNQTIGSAYALTWSNVQCGPKAHYTRFGIVTGSYSNSSLGTLSNLTILSCIPSYWMTVGLLTVNVVPGKPVRFANFIPEENNMTEFRPFFYTDVEDGLPSYASFDPSHSLNGDLWGHLIYSMASRQSSGNPLDSNVIKTSMETLYSSFFVSMVSTYAFQPSKHVQQVNATLAEPLTRLFVVSPVAWTVAIIMALVLVCNVFLILYSERTKSILHEEPIGLLGNAALLQDSDVSEIVSQIRGNPPQVFNVRQRVKSEYSPDTVQCWYDDGTKRILVSGLRPDKA
jgi:hypothetical protein